MIQVLHYTCMTNHNRAIEMHNYLNMRNLPQTTDNKFTTAIFVFYVGPTLIGFEVLDQIRNQILNWLTGLSIDWREKEKKD